MLITFSGKFYFSDDSDVSQVKVVMLGDSLVTWAAHHLLTDPPGLDLQIPGAEIIWRGIRGCRLKPLDMSLDRVCERGSQPPDILLIHLGTNDIGHSGSAWELRTLVRAFIREAHRRFPRALLVWSDILPRQRWLGMSDQRAAMKILKGMNASAHRIICALGGVVITHKLIKYNKLDLFNDYVHLSKTGNSILCNDWREGLSRLL